MSEALLIAVVTALVNGAVTWGIIATKLAWLRQDVDKMDQRISNCEARHNATDHRYNVNRRHIHD